MLPVLVLAVSGCTGMMECGDSFSCFSVALQTCTPASFQPALGETIGQYGNLMFWVEGANNDSCIVRIRYEGTMNQSLEKNCTLPLDYRVAALETLVVKAAECLTGKTMEPGKPDIEGLTPVSDIRGDPEAYLGQKVKVWGEMGFSDDELVPPEAGIGFLVMDWERFHQEESMVEEDFYLLARMPEGAGLEEKADYLQDTVFEGTVRSVELEGRTYYYLQIE